MRRSQSDNASRRNVTVFEAANNDLKEVYVTWTSRPIFEAMAEIGTRPPSAIAHWHPDRQHVSFRSLEFQLSEDAARAFVSHHIAKPLPDRWKYILDSSSGRPHIPS